MAILLVAGTFLLRFLAPHEIHPALKPLPLVPAATGLMALAAVYSLIRKRLVPGMPIPVLAQWALFLWVGVSLVVNEGGGATRLVGSNLTRDLFFVSLVVLIVDRLKRLKILVAALVASYVVIVSFGLPQLWGPTQCAEWAEGDMANLQFDGRSCNVTPDCFRNQPKQRLIPGIGPRLYRCERRGPFKIAAYIGRMRWVGNLADANNLGASIALVIPMVVLWAGSLERKRWLLRWLLLPGLAGLLVVGVMATGSRGSQLGMIVGLGIAGWRLLGKKMVVVGALAAIGLAVLLMVGGGKGGLRDEGTYESSTKVSDRYRADAMATGYRLWKEFPVFGVGYLNFEQHHLIDPHNAFLCSLGEAGTVGLLLFAFGMWMSHKAAWVARAQAKREGRAQLATFFGGIQAGMIGGTMSLTLFLSTWAAMTWLVVVMIGSGTYRAAKAEMPETTLRLTYWDVLGAIVLAFTVIGVAYLSLAFYYYRN